MHGDRLGEASDPPDLDVDDAARAQFEGGFGVARAADGFIQADRRLQVLLQSRVEVEIVAPQRLLDHQQLERSNLLR